MTCKFIIYKPIYYRKDKEYASFVLNLEKLKRQERNISLNMLMREEKCDCYECNPNTGTRGGI